MFRVKSCCMLEVVPILHGYQWIVVVDSSEQLIDDGSAAAARVMSRAAAEVVATVSDSEWLSTPSARDTNQ